MTASAFSRTLMSKMLACAACLFSPSLVSAQDAVDAALKRAADYLVSVQDQKTGAIQSEKRNETAMTSLAVLALASLGHQPADVSREGECLRKALAFVLRPEGQTPEGYFGREDGSRMYGHGITTLMLAEMLGMGGDARQDSLIRERCQRAIELIIRAQKVPKSERDHGGWRYSPDQAESDLSVTVWQVMALRSAKNAGLEVPREPIEHAVGYIKRLYKPEKGERGSGGPGGFGYQGPSLETSTTTEGLLALQVCGEYASEEVQGAAAKLMRDGIRKGDKWLYYTTYYYAQGMYQHSEQAAAAAERLVADLLLGQQSREGWWEGVGGEERQGGKVYATAMAVLSLAVKNHFLPIYQR
ncbi:MAG TPA: prenyltransferase/squalene oxidase repeat-containing protein [Chthoniobacteraceae bacterium]|jgi:hypothetical protein|nr:hypothetical protein [Chthoniobacter sp.]HEV7869197.1 prenyltransferase/squalene oxidase repeat-containing protein [Chthoniobacteraceae bacterium]